MREYKVVGVMSGSSLDGLDVCLATFCFDQAWSFRLDRVKKYDLSAEWTEKLKSSPTCAPTQLKTMDLEYGEWIGHCIRDFLQEEKVDLAGVHGHTVFHFPKEHRSFQLGSGASIATNSGVPCVTDFRIGDILKGGQGAPLVPVGEYHLFPDVSTFVNLGGIANVTVRNGTVLQAWDVAPCNQVFNYLVSPLGLSYDNGGVFARSGKWDPAFYNQLSQLAFFSQKPPKSLGNHWVRESILEVIDLKSALLADLAHTYCHFLADQLIDTFNIYLPVGTRVLFTGGGVYNRFLIELIEERANGRFWIDVPSPEVIEYKEALIFGFLGLLRLRNEINVFASVTGASEDSCCGVISYPN